jgi:phosphoserine phosphatase
MAGTSPKLVCFDLDGTVMVHPNSLQYLCWLNRAPEHILADIDEREHGGEIDWIAADHERARLIAGLPVASVEEYIDGQLLMIGNMELVLDTLRSRGILTVLITSGPVEVAQAVARRFAFDRWFGSQFEICRASGHVYSGRITRHLGSTGKLDCLLQLCHSTQIALRDCVAVGDGESDIALFRAVGMAIGINCSDDMTQFVHHEVRGHDLSLILPFVLGGTGSC